MDLGDGFHVLVNLAIGLLLGSAAYHLLQLVVSGAWVMVIILLLLGGTLFGIVVLSDKLMDWIFPSGIRQVGPSQARKAKPLLRVLALPVGLAVGVLLASLGLDTVLLDLLP